ncbi:MAG TPA: SDR family NAD(P)-dependent oxidoreductase [Acetobacteraceae bacterium]|jgi:3-oxoacyl-[acyl-carrier protein] reductase|nr:SDR family NAD(P)-dependent oxidoreductase [Acetobacteraceae bacterium]
MDIRFPGRTVLVTGAGHGIGRGIAHAFAGLGARTIAADLNAAGLAETSAGAPKPLESMAFDVADRTAVQVAVGSIGTVDILVHSAGGVRGQVGRPVEDIPEPDWHAILAANLTGAFLVAQAVIPAMKAAGRGRIVTISSGAGIGVSLTGIQAYAAAKAGEIGLTRQLAHELGPFGITVNSVAPGFVRSNPSSERQWEAYGPEGQQRLVETIALRRLGTVADITHAVLFLASEFAGWISGQTLSVNGGK